MVYLTGPTFMAVGDSITYGFGDATVIANGAWRYHIADPLETFLRTKFHWRGTMQALGAQKAGMKMLGTSGRRIDQLLSLDNPTRAFTNTIPDLIAIHLGTNDMTQTDSGAWVGGSVATSIANMSTLLDIYRAAVPKGIAVVCLIMPNTTGSVDTLITQWNTDVQTMIAGRSDAAFIVTSDVNAAFKANATWATDYMYDVTHPNDNGEQVIATTIMSTISSNVTIPPRFPALRRRGIKPHVAGLRYTASTATDLGATTFLDSTLPWAVSMDINLDRNQGSPSSASGILCLKTDQATPFVFCTLPQIGKGGRGLEMGSSANFLRLFPSNSIDPNSYNKFCNGHHQILVIFDGVSRTALSSYTLFIDGVYVQLASGAGLGATSNVNEIGRVIAGGSAGTFDMCDLTIWNGGTAMTAAQARDWFYNNIVPSGPKMTHRYQHTDGSGSTLTDTGSSPANGTIGSATWHTNVPTVSRTDASPRTTAVARVAAS